MSAPFTPGPWKIVPYGDGDSLVICEEDDNWRICFMATPGDSPGAWQTIKANARLISAAPELYEALRALVEWLSPSGLRQRVLDEANAALTKAGGEQ